MTVRILVVAFAAVGFALGLSAAVAGSPPGFRHQASVTCGTGCALTADLRTRGEAVARGRATSSAGGGVKLALLFTKQARAKLG